MSMLWQGEYLKTVDNRLDVSKVAVLATVVGALVGGVVLLFWRRSWRYRLQ